MKYFEKHTCPWWFIGTFDNPLRPLLHQPERILAGLAQEGQTVLDIGPGMGYFTLPLARMVGPMGKVFAADLQPQMLAGLRRRAERAGLAGRIELHQALPERIGLATQVDFALAFWMLHEVRDQAAFLEEVYSLLKPGAAFLVVEPLIHVSSKLYQQEIQAAAAAGFQILPGPAVQLSRSALLGKA
jgi:ubiquinone/menaquinone biosynthesis C-methylase UbiE